MTRLRMAGLGLHFILELSAWASMAVWGFQPEHSMGQKILFGVGMPLLAMAVWGIFRVPNDPGRAPVTIPGPLRLLLELVILGGGAACLYAAGYITLALVFGAAVIIDYLIMSDRVARLLRG